MKVKLITKSPKRVDRRHCEHPERLTTVNYGLERSVCTTCGDVTVKDIGSTGSGELFQSLAPIHHR